MGVFTYVCRNSRGEWSGKQVSGDPEASAGSTHELQRKLVQTCLAVYSSGGVQSSFSFITPTSAVFQAIVGAVGGGAFIEVVDLLAQPLQPPPLLLLLRLLLPRRRKKRRRRAMRTWDSHSLIRLLWLFNHLLFSLNSLDHCVALS